MTNKFVGYSLGLAALFSVLGLLAIDIKSFQSWSDATTPGFAGSVLAHISTVGMAFLGGKLIPTEPQNQREDDQEKK